jgi:hypothetical protein
VATQSFAAAIAAAEQIIRSAPHVRTEQDLAEGLDYLAGSIKAALHMAWAYERDFPFFAASTGPYTSTIPTPSISTPMSATTPSTSSPAAAAPPLT